MGEGCGLRLLRPQWQKRWRSSAAPITCRWFRPRQGEGLTRLPGCGLPRHEDLRTFVLGMVNLGFVSFQITQEPWNSLHVKSVFWSEGVFVCVVAHARVCVVVNHTTQRKIHQSAQVCFVTDVICCDFKHSNRFCFRANWVKLHVTWIKLLWKLNWSHLLSTCYRKKQKQKHFTNCYDHKGLQDKVNEIFLDPEIHQQFRGEKIKTIILY